MVMIHSHAKGQSQKSLDLEVGVETDGWTDGVDDWISSRANAVGNITTLFIIDQTTWLA